MHKTQNIHQRVIQTLNKTMTPFELISLPDENMLDVDVIISFLGIRATEAVATLIFATENGLIAVQKCSDTRVDTKRLKSLAGVQNIRFATVEELSTLGVTQGIVPLTGLSIPFFLDNSVRNLSVLYGGSGDATKTLKMTPQDLIQLNMPVVGDFTSGSSIQRKRVLTGDTPTGKLHIGHYVGTLENRVKLQDEYETFIIIADVHAFTTLSAFPEKVQESVMDVALDNLSVGLNPEKAHIFIESQIPEIYELAAIFSMLVPHSRALRNPTIKDEIVMKGQSSNFSLGFVNYPMYQAADITCVGANLVPVGKDQLAHIEQTHEIVDKFNGLYGDTLVRPEALVGKIGKLVGTDGNPKMGKSLNNTIMLSATTEEVKQAVMDMYTDPNRIHATDPGRVEGNPVFIYHDIFNSNSAEVADLKERYGKGKVGDVEVKTKLFTALELFLGPIRERRSRYANNPKLVKEILAEGTRVARIETQRTLEKVREAMRMKYG